jgi:hypothetical protein
MVTPEKKNVRITKAVPAEWIDSIKKTMHAVCPELISFENKIHHIYASTNSEYALCWRPIEDIVEEIKQAYANGKMKIIFYNNPETMIDTLIYKSQRAIELVPEIPETTFIFTTASPSGQEVYDRMYACFGWTRRMRVLSFDHFEHTIHEYMMNDSILHEKEYEVKIKQKKFVCFNKVHRIHRAKLLADMYDNDLVKDAFYSFEGSHPGWLDEYVTLYKNKLHQAEKYKFIKYKFIKTLFRHKYEFPLRLNITSNRHNPVDLQPEDLLYHQESYFSVVTETIFYDDSYVPLTLLAYEEALFISEKTYKAIAFKHPFIVMCRPNTLSYLVDSGYKTFHPYIDESYDIETNDDKRFTMIVNEIKRLCSMTNDQWIEWQKNIKDIVEHNYTVLVTRKNFHNIKDIDKMFE